MNPRNQRGAVIPLIALLLVVIVVSVAFVVDLGHVHNIKGELQRAVDAAALAGARQLPNANKVDAVAVATAAQNTADREAVVVAPEDVILGIWDTTNLTATPSDRFTPSLVEPNAVYVRASRSVDHAFFFFLDATEVTADAIALKEFRKQTIPVAVTTCIPSGGETYPGILSPGTSACDLAIFRFAAGNLDTAAWTSLTVRNANSNNMEYFFGEDGIRLFNEIIYGDGPDGTNPGLEFETVTNDGSCTTTDNEIVVNDFEQLINVNVNINCGLGGEFTDQSPRPADPLNYAPLPRWYDKNDFARVFSMNGLLQQGANETDGQYATRMLALYTASQNDDFTGYNTTYAVNQVPADLMDDRFTRYIITKQNGNFDHVDSRIPLIEAGYPQVHLIEGLTETVTDFAKMIITSDGNQFTSTRFMPSASNVYPPFDSEHSSTSGAEGHTVLLYVPIIFTGNCDDTAYNKPAIYVGLANVLLTRLWTTTNECFDNGDNSAVVSITCPAPAGYTGKFGSSKQNYTNPELTADQLLCTNGFEPKSFEGLLLEPLTDEETESGLARYLLVE